LETKRGMKQKGIVSVGERKTTKMLERLALHSSSKDVSFSTGK
jgi:hypothetical protein